MADGGRRGAPGGQASLPFTGPAPLGLANLAGPGSAARTAAPAIGLGVALVASVWLISVQPAPAGWQGFVAESAPAAGLHRNPGRPRGDFDAHD